jgi:D-alanyl-D-alanine carboxypeptidase (penicillin-binding protein 5/6)
MNIREPRDFDGVRSKRRTKHTLHKVRKALLAAFVVVLAFTLLGYASYARALPLITAQTTLPAIETTDVAITWPAQGQASLGVVGQGVMASTSSQTPVPTASTTKIMVAYMVLKKHPLEPGQQGPTFTITPSDVADYNAYIAKDGSALRVEAGEQLTQYQALQALLLPSANNIADLLAVWAYGSLPAYFEAANAEAKTLGMTQSTFAGDAGGLSPKTMSTAHDMTLLGQVAMQNAVIKQIVGQKTAILPVVGQVQNTNVLLGRSGIIGTKTGHTDEAGGAYMFAADHTLPNGKVITAVGTIMGSPNLPTAMGGAIPLLNSFYQGFSEVTVVKQGQQVAEYSVPWADKVPATAAQNLSVMGWRATKPTVSVATEAIKAPQAAGAEVGKVTANTPFGEASVPIALSQPIAEPTWMWRVTRH